MELGCIVEWMPAATRRILFVDTDESLRLLIQRVLTRYGIEVDVVGEAQEAIAKLAAETYQVVVVDLLQTKDASYGVIRAVALMPLSQRPVVIATGDPAADSRADAEVISLIIRKPYDVQSLVEMIVASLTAGAGESAPEPGYEAERRT